MILDAHTHVWAAADMPEPVRDYLQSRGHEAVDVTASDLLASMDDNGIDRALVAALPVGPDDDAARVKSINDYVRRQVRQAPHRLAAFCTVNPLDPTAPDQLRRCVEDLGFRGLKVHGSIHRMAVDDERMYPLFAVMQSFRLPVLMHSGGMGVRPYGDDFTRVHRFDAVANAFPDMPLILGHAGRMDHAMTAELLRKHPQVYADISSNIGRTKAAAGWPIRELMANVAGWAGSTERILFGSDFPLYDQGVTIAELDAAAPRSGDPFTQGDLRAVLESNGETFLDRIPSIFTTPSA